MFLDEFLVILGGGVGFVLPCGRGGDIVGWVLLENTCHIFAHHIKDIVERNRQEA
jgi:hypothetical protein